MVQTLGQSARIPLQFVIVRVTHVQQAGRQAVRREDQLHLAVRVGVKLEHRGADGGLLCIQKPGLPAPRIHRRKPDPAARLFLRFLQLRPVSADTHLRVVRRHHDTHRLAHTIVVHPGHSVFDPGHPVTHPDVDHHVMATRTKQRFGLARLLESALVQRRLAADLGVAPPKLPHECRRHRPAAADIFQVCRHVVK